MDGKFIWNPLWMNQILTFVVATGYEKDTVLEDHHLTSLSGFSLFLPPSIGLAQGPRRSHPTPKPYIQCHLAFYACCLYQGLGSGNSKQSSGQRLSHLYSKMACILNYFGVAVVESTGLNSRSGRTINYNDRIRMIPRTYYQEPPLARSQKQPKPGNSKYL